MSETDRVLIAIDDSEASIRALGYVGRMISRCGNYEIHLCHVLRACPPELLEFRGAEDSQEEERLDAELEVKEARLVAEQKLAARPILEASRRILIESGAVAASVHTHFQAPTAHEGLVTESSRRRPSTDATRSWSAAGPSRGSSP